jgi:hypothetical protein
VAAALGAVTALLILVTWLRWRPTQSSRDRDFSVVLEASRRQTRALGTVALKARIEPASGNVSHGPEAYSVAWSSQSGILRRRGDEAQWIAPGEGGSAVIRAQVTGPGGLTRQAEVAIEVVALRSDVTITDDGVAELTPVDTDGYVLEGIELDKTSACAREDVLVRVSASDPDGLDEWLRTKVTFAGVATWGTDRAVVRTPWRYEEVYKEKIAAGEIPTLRVEVIDQRIRAPVLERDVEFQITQECVDAEAGVRVACELAGVDRRVTCRAMVSKETNRAFEPTRYLWDFGDGSAPRETAEGKVDHDLEPRVQRSATQTYVVRAEAFDASGKSLVGRASVEVPNHEWTIMRMDHRLDLPVQWEPYPRRRGDDLITNIVVVNPFPESIDLTAVETISIPCERGSEPRIERRPSRLEELAPGQVVRSSWRMDDDRSICQVSATIEGIGQESGLPAIANFGVPTQAEGEPVDEETSARLHKALQILSDRRGHPVDRVTARELRALDKQGLLGADDLDGLAP